MSGAAAGRRRRMISRRLRPKILRALEYPAPELSTEDDSEDEEDYELQRATHDGQLKANYEIFARKVLHKAVSTVISMGWSVDWDRVSRFLVHNNTMQKVRSSDHPEDAVTLTIDSKLKELFASMMTRVLDRKAQEL